MQDNNLNYENIPLEKFEFVHDGDRISDKKFEDKPISYFKDAWIRFRKNRASVTYCTFCIHNPSVYKKL